MFLVRVVEGIAILLIEIGKLGERRGWVVLGFIDWKMLVGYLGNNKLVVEN